MSDLIDRKKALDEISKIDTSIIPSGWVKGYVDETIKETQRIIRTIPSAEPERMTMVWKPAKGRPMYESGICSCGYVLTVLQRDFIYCPHCGSKLVWSK